MKRVDLQAFKISPEMSGELAEALLRVLDLADWVEKHEAEGLLGVGADIRAAVEGEK